MTRFTKQEMLDELRTIFLYEADHILMGAGDEAARLFIGFAPEDVVETEGSYCFLPSESVDLSRFNGHIAGAFDRGYEYAFRPSTLNTIDESEIQDLHSFMLGTPRAGGVRSASGETHVFMTPSGLCQQVADTAHARWKLEWVPERELGPFTTRELALLADMTEGAVRNAMADKSESGLRAIPGSKNPVTVEHAEASRWLSGRRGFVPTPDRPSTDRFLSEDLQSIQSSEALGQMIGRFLRRTFGHPKDAEKELGWPQATIDQWIDGSQTFDQDRARFLAQALDLEVPLFVGKALEVTLRRDEFLGKKGK